MSDEKVYLKQAFSFECPTCGAENFGHPAPSEFTEEDIAHIRETQGIDPSEQGQWVHLPKKVKCKCGEEHETILDEELEEPTP